MRYSLASGSRPMTLEVNGEQIGTLDFPATGSGDTWEDQAYTVTLPRGIHTIRMESTGSGAPNLDSLRVRDR